MFLPTTYATSLLLLVLASILLGVWPGLFMRNLAWWRYQLFSLDFSLGALALAAVFATTLGMLGPDATFTDRMLIAGGIACVSALAAGIFLGLGNLLLLSGASVLGLSPTVLVSASLACLVAGGFSFTSANFRVVSVALMLLLLTLRMAIQAARARSANVSPKMQRFGRGLGMALAAGSGVLFGVAQLLLGRISDPEYGPGAYACVLLMTVGILVGTSVASVFLFKISIEGPPLSAAAYLQGRRTLHLPGLLAGMLWAGGALAAFLAIGTSGEASAGRALNLILPGASAVICVGLATGRWDGAGPASPTGRRSILLGTVAYLVGIIVLGIGWSIRTE